uniref:STAS domain-containing protein n=1 Tax=Ascaris lumbricoides TaxID=6252 RepID=A0A0M3ISD0_ASCLU
MPSPVTNVVSIDIVTGHITSFIDLTALSVRFSSELLQKASA